MEGGGGVRSGDGSVGDGSTVVIVVVVGASERKDSGIGRGGSDSERGA